MNTKYALAIVCVLILVLQACSNTSPTPTSGPTETATLATFTSTPTPTPTLTPTSTPTPIPFTWKQISDGQEFERDIVTAFATDTNDPNVIYAGMKNTGVYKTVDGGISWQPALHGLTTKQVESLLINSQNPHILYAGTMGGVFKTEDGGENWFRIGEGTYLLMDYQDNYHLYSRDKNGIYETKDQGNTWETVYSLKKDCPDVVSSWAIHPSDGNILFIGGGETCTGIYQSSDGGGTWALIGMKDKPSTDTIAIGLDKEENTVIYADFPDNLESDIGIYISYDGGGSWSHQREPRCNIFTADPNEPSIIYCGDLFSLWIRQGKGYSWQIIPGTQSINFTAIHIDHPNGTNRIITSGTKLTYDPEVDIFISTDGGTSWVKRDNRVGLARTELKFDPVDGTSAYLATYFVKNLGEEQCNLYHSTDRGNSWSTIKTKASWCGPAFDAAHVLYLNQGGKLQQSRTDGDTWLWDPHEGPYSELYNPNSGQDIVRSLVFALPSYYRNGRYFNGARSVSANPYFEDFVYDAGNEFYYSTDGGSSWQSSVGNDGLLDARLFYTDQSKMIYAIGRYHQTYSTDNGKTWQNCGQNVTASRSDTRLALDLQGSRLYLATPGQGVMVSTDDCQSWQASNEGLSNLFINTVEIDPNNPDTIYAGTDGGAFISFDSGQTWGQVNEGLLGTTVVYSIAVDPESNVYAATPYGIFKLQGK